MNDISLEKYSAARRLTELLDGGRLSGKADIRGLGKESIHLLSFDEWFEAQVKDFSWQHKTLMPCPSWPQNCLVAQSEDRQMRNQTGRGVFHVTCLTRSDLPEEKVGARRLLR